MADIRRRWTRYEGRVQQARAQATSVRRALDTSEAALTEIDQLQRLKLATTPTVEVIDALTKLLPNSVWLTDLRLENGFLDMTGLAKSGAALLPLFEHSPLFRRRRPSIGRQLRSAGKQGALQPARARAPTGR